MIVATPLNCSCSCSCLRAYHSRAFIPCSLSLCFLYFAKLLTLLPSYSTAISGCQGRRGRRPAPGPVRPRAIGRAATSALPKARANGIYRRGRRAHATREWTLTAERMRNWCSRAHAERRKGTRLAGRAHDLRARACDGSMTRAALQNRNDMRQQRMCSAKNLSVLAEDGPRK